ncbi:MAG: class I tRNA ligase family protein [Thiotrichaceae bacterium]
MDSQTSRKILSSVGTPYANGSIHLGHLVEYIQTDIWVRFQVRGQQCYYVCRMMHMALRLCYGGQQEVTPQQLIDRVHQRTHQRFCNLCGAI